ncbi:hypothetical protein E2C01_025227 [Portunus trituberculatus]|uniref:Uncharacterized protein n=1 Tax=Portunus trituberculatus TaxID=210409 RepID=A0A5B7EF10_PORTR|nr:hypothetical protein [Portunus trituberculatus]
MQDITYPQSNVSHYSAMGAASWGAVMCYGCNEARPPEECHGRFIARQEKRRHILNPERMPLSTIRLTCCPANSLARDFHCIPPHCKQREMKEGAGSHDTHT